MVSYHNVLYCKSLFLLAGVLMVIAYPVLLLTAVFFAAWMKPTMPKMWFQIHRALTLASLVIALTAFAVVFIANKDNTTPGIINLHDCVSSHMTVFLTH